MWRKSDQIEREIRQENHSPKADCREMRMVLRLAELIEAENSQAGQLGRYLCSACRVQHKLSCPQDKVVNVAENDENERPQGASATWKAGSWQTDWQQGSAGFPKPDLIIRPVSLEMQPDICKHKYEQTTKDNWTAPKIQYYPNKRTALNCKEICIKELTKGYLL